MTRPNDPNRLCTATAKSTGNRCGNPAIPGGTVCKSHGGAAPQVQRKARLRLAELVDPAIVLLGRVISDPQAAYSDRIRAAENALDRAGYPRSASIEVEDARELLRARLETLRAEREAVEAGE